MILLNWKVQKLKKGVEEWKQLIRKIIGSISQYVKIGVFHYVANETDVYALWTKLEVSTKSRTQKIKIV